MARFIEVTPLNYARGESTMLINVEKINYVEKCREDSVALHLSDVPYDIWGERKLFPSTLYISEPFIYISDEIATYPVVERGNQK